jgi:ubiquinone/menaquinone biosynthesis C-methylase UbiE
VTGFALLERLKRAMSPTQTPATYVLGSADLEHDRLIRQGKRLESFTERLFRDAGIGPGQRVMDIGSGVGDVALLAARLVGPTGAVLGVDRDAIALGKARARAVERGVAHVRFVESDVSEVTGEAPFDAVVGRFILMFLPDPVTVLRMLAARVRPGGALVFQEASWPSFLTQAAHLPLWSSCAELIAEALRRSGVRTEMGLVLYRGFQDIGFPVPKMRLDVPIDQGPDTRRWLYDLICTLQPRFEELGLSHEAVGDLGTLGDGSSANSTTRARMPRALVWSAPGHASPTG